MTRGKLTWNKEEELELVCVSLEASCCMFKTLLCLRLGVNGMLPECRRPCHVSAIVPPPAHQGMFGMKLMHLFTSQITSLIDPNRH